MNIYHPAQGALTAAPTVANWANPMQFTLQRDPGRQPDGLPGFRAELCAIPGADPRRDQVQLSAVRREPGLHTGVILPKFSLYSEPRLPAPGYKDTTVPGIWSQDTCSRTVTMSRAGQWLPACRVWTYSRSPPTC